MSLKVLAEWVLGGGPLLYAQVPSDQLQQLVELGYSEAQGVEMLDAVFPEEGK